MLSELLSLAAICLSARFSLRSFVMLSKYSLYFANSSSIIIGDFSESANDLDYDSVEQMLHPYLIKMNIPVCCGFPIGHGDINLPLICGAKVKLTVNEHESVLSFSVIGQNYIINYPE